MNKRLLNVGLIVLIDMLGFALIVPLLAFFADTFGATPFQTGLLVATYAAMQMISSASLGRLSDSSFLALPIHYGGCLQVEFFRGLPQGISP